MDWGYREGPIFYIIFVYFIVAQYAIEFFYSNLSSIPFSAFFVSINTFWHFLFIKIGNIVGSRCQRLFTSGIIKNILSV